tara:strand:+ start:52 stop:696 length:645 start_codon:yes stop_codon:yes gene_type:complete
MRLGLFNWTSDLSDEPEYPPLFDKLWAESPSIYHTYDGVLKRCLVDVGLSFDRSVEHKKIGMIEYNGGIPYETLKKSFGEEEWEELEKYQENAFYGAYREGSFMHMILNEPVFIMVKSPDTVFPLTSEDSKLNFYHWEDYDWWFCINREWNAQLVKILERKNPDVMEEFAKCLRERELSGMTVGEIKEILRNANLSTSGKKTDLVQRIIDHNLI